MKKISEKCIIINYALLIVLLFSIVAISSQISTINTLSNGLYTSDTKSFMLESTDDQNIEFDILYSSLERNTILYKVLDINHDYRAIAIKGEVKPPPMLEGRYFTEADFNQNINYAVIGKKVLSLTHVNANERFLYFDGKEYLVIGVMGMEKASGIDYSVFVNMNTVDNFHNTYGLYSLDSNSVKVKSTLDHLTQNGMVLTLIDQTNMSALNLLSSYASEINFTILIFISLLISSMALINAWIQDNKDQIIIRRLCGFTHHMILRDYMKKYLSSIGISIILALPFIILILMVFGCKLLLTLPAIILLFCISALSSTIIFKASYKKILLEVKKL